MGPPTFQEINARLERAHKHLGSFQEEVRQFLLPQDSHGMGLKLRDKGDGLFEVFVFLRVYKSPPIHLSLLAGEFVHQLRACLDHIVYTLSIPNLAILGGKEQDLETIEFPIFKDSAAFSHRSSKGKRRGSPVRGSGLHKVRFVSPAAQAIIKSLQPYTAGSKADTHPLWVLHELNRIEKHRRLHLLGAPIGGFKLTQELGPFDLISKEEFGARPLKNDAIVAKAIIRAKPGFQGKVCVEGYVPAHVAFEESITLPKRYAGEIMQDILIFVEREVVLPLTPFIQ